MSRYSSLKKQERLMGYLFILPNFIGVLIFVLLPVIAGLLISFTKWDLLTPPCLGRSRQL